MLSQDIKHKLISLFDKLDSPVEIVLDLSDTELSYKVKQLVEELASLSNKIYVKEENKNSNLKPCIYIKTLDGNYNIGYCGLPSGGEFQTFIDTILMVSKNNYNISQRTLEILEQLDEPVNIKIFITKSCGWCPPTIKKMYSFAMVSKHIQAFAIDCYDFPEEATRYNVSSVPKVVINDKVEFVGHREENDILGYIISAVGR